MAFFGNLFSNIFQHGNTNDASVVDNKTFSQNGFARAMYSVLGKDSPLTEKEVMSIPAVADGVETIANSISQLNIILYQKDDKGNDIPITDDYRLTLLNKWANENMTAQALKYMITKDLVLYGTSKSYLNHNSPTSNEITGIYPIPTRNIRIKVLDVDNIHQEAIVENQKANANVQYYDDLLLSCVRHSDNGIYGHGIIDLNSDVLRLGIKQRDYELNLLDNGAVPMSVIESDDTLSPKKIDAVSAAWSKAYTTVRNAGRTVLLEKGLHYKQAALSPDKMQLTEGKASLLSDVSRILNIPESILNSQANKYASNEQNNEFYLQYCLAPILIIIEQSLDRMLLTEQEKTQGLFFKFDVSGFAKVNFQNTVQNATNAFNAGAITNVEFRRIIGAPVNQKVEDYEYTKMTTGQVMFNVNNGVITNPNTQQNMNINTGEVTGNNSSPADSSPVQQQDDGNKLPNDDDSISTDNSENEEGENND